MTAPTFLIGEIGHYCNRDDVTRRYITCQYAAVYTSVPLGLSVVKKNRVQRVISNKHA
jgi:hypothetical protein